MLKAEPNAGHRALATLVEQGRMSAIITQNVDGLHQRSGIPDSKIIELHGNTTYATCLDCGHRHELSTIRRNSWRKARCRSARSVKVSLRRRRFPRSGDAGSARVAGTGRDAGQRSVHRDRQLAGRLSGGRFPAACQAQRREVLVILNREPTDQDVDADLVIHREIGPTLSRAIGVN